MPESEDTSQQATWVDVQIRRAMERGEFDNLPGQGKPIADLGGQHDPDWWVKRLVQRENLALLPPALALRREDAELDATLAAGRLDLTLPAPPRRRGAVHPVMQVMDEMIAIFAEMGFSLAEGPDIEDDFHNFTALNFPPRHPAREMHDTFFFSPGPDGERKLLRTHTSPVQIRTMRQGNAPPSAPWIASGREPPIRIISPGRTYRCDSDATHTPMFHQIEGLVIDRTIHMGHLKWTLDQFIARFFELKPPAGVERLFVSPWIAPLAFSRGGRNSSSCDATQPLASPKTARPRCASELA